MSEDNHGGKVSSAGAGAKGGLAFATELRLMSPIAFLPRSGASTIVSSSDDQSRDDLRQAGLRATAPRIAVLALLRSSRLPLSHAEVVSSFGDRDWDRATIFRNLKDLVRIDLARRVDRGDRVWRFEATDTVDEHLHPHFICHDCGQVECLDDVDVDLSPGQQAPKVLGTGDFEVQIKGQCDQCREDNA